MDSFEVTVHETLMILNAAPQFFCDGIRPASKFQDVAKAISTAADICRCHAVKILSMRSNVWG
jgi:hypothetical protein